MNRIVVTCSTLSNITFVPTVILAFYQSNMKDRFYESYITLHNMFPNADIIGCSSESNIYNESPHLDIDGENESIFVCVDISKDAYSLKTISSETDQSIDIDPTVEWNALLLASSSFTNIDNILDALRSKIGQNALFGGIASVEDAESEIGDVFINGIFHDDSIIVWLIDQDKYILEGTTLHHFQPVGFEMEVTEAKGSTIYEIEGQPALKIVEEIIGEITQEGITSFDHPFFLKHSLDKNFTEAPLCSIKSIDREKYYIDMYRNITNGDKVKVGISLNQKEQKDQSTVFKKYAKKYAVGFMFNCVGIKGNLGSMEALYLMYIKRNLHIPFAGFHTFGEIGSVNESSASILHNQTISMAILSEKKI